MCSTATLFPMNFIQNYPELNQRPGGDKPVSNCQRHVLVNSPTRIGKSFKKNMHTGQEKSKPANSINLPHFGQCYMVQCT